MRSRFLPAVALLAVALGFAASASAAPEGWHANMKEGLEASAKSNKPLLVITAWARKL